MLYSTATVYKVVMASGWLDRVELSHEEESTEISQLTNLSGITCMEKKDGLVERAKEHIMCTAAN